MPKFEVIEAKEFHCGQILRRLRIEHREAIERVGANAHHELRALFDSSYLRRAWLIDGKLAALGGVSGSIMSHYGFVWVALSSEAMKYPVALVREAKRQIEEIMATKSQLVTTIVGGDDGAKRFAIFLGFHCDHDGLGSPAYSKFSRRNLANYLESTPDLRVPIGKGYIIPMGYHPD
jgi:hypothetical protein